ncbi:MAG: hypothetical protein KAT70_05220, partial [Thermoplasmata archaeon]|nr:hypothetical protein [Thermoplasmata archaeon]
MRTAENVMAAWALVQRGALSMEYNENNRSLWSFRFDENALVVKIHDLEGVIALLDEMVRASAPVRDSFMKIVEASGYEPEGLMFSKLDMASISKFAWVGEYLAQNGKRVEIVLEDQLLVAVGNDTKPG